jgi:hypothetical protein
MTPANLVVLTPSSARISKQWNGRVDPNVEITVSFAVPSISRFYRLASHALPLRSHIIINACPSTPAPAASG